MVCCKQRLKQKGQVLEKAFLCGKPRWPPIWVEHGFAQYVVDNFAATREAPPSDELIAIIHTLWDLSYSVVRSKRTIRCEKTVITCGSPGALSTSATFLQTISGEAMNVEDFRRLALSLPGAEEG